MVSCCTSDAPRRYTRETLVLDRLIERRERGEKQLPVITDGVAARLAAAEVLTQLREIAVIFDPFFTTQEVGAGTGSGLPITYGISKEHQGTIAVENRPDEGALFLIQLPLKPS
jgi:C4-dicarboxylate-specific signal transduction histidine kinase